MTPKTLSLFGHRLRMVDAAKPYLWLWKRGSSWLRVTTGKGDLGYWKTTVWVSEVKIAESFDLSERVSRKEAMRWACRWALRARKALGP